MRGRSDGHGTPVVAAAASSGLDDPARRAFRPVWTMPLSLVLRTVHATSETPGAEVEWVCCSNHGGQRIGPDCAPPPHGDVPFDRGVVFLAALEAVLLGDASRFAELFTEDVEFCSPHLTVESLDAVQRALGAPEDSLTDVEIVVLALDSVDDKVIAEWRLDAMFTRPVLFDDGLLIEPTGGRVQLPGASVAEFRRARIRAFRHYFDDSELLAGVPGTPSHLRWSARSADADAGSLPGGDGSSSPAATATRRHRCVTTCRACGRWRSSGTSPCCARRRGGRRSPRRRGASEATAAPAARPSSASDGPKPANGPAPATSRRRRGQLLGDPTAPGVDLEDRARLVDERGGLVAVAAETAPAGERDARLEVEPRATPTRPVEVLAAQPSVRRPPRQPGRRVSRPAR